MRQLPYLAKHVLHQPGLDEAVVQLLKPSQEYQYEKGLDERDGNPAPKLPYNDIKPCPNGLEAVLNAGVHVNTSLESNCSEDEKKDYRCTDGWTLAHFSARYGGKDLELLKKQHADMSAKDKQGLTPVHVAVRFNQHQSFSLLGKVGASRDPRHAVCTLPGLAVEISRRDRRLLQTFLFCVSAIRFQRAGHPRCKPCSLGLHVLDRYRQERQ